MWIIFILYFFSCMHRNGHFFCLKCKNELTFCSVTWRHLMVQKITKKWGCWRKSRNCSPTLRKKCYWIKRIFFQKHVYHGFESICYRISNIFISSCSIFLWINSTHAFGKKCFWFNSIFFSVHMRKLLIIPTGIIDNPRTFRVYSKKGIFFPRFRQKSGHFCACMRRKCFVL